MTKVLGHAPSLSKDAQPVPAGIARIVELAEQGYLVVRP
jgi:intracellular sulfur oxidation DsrE/DsrF family protein